MYDLDDVQVLTAWIAVKCADIQAVAKSLSLRDVQAGTFGDIFPDSRDSSKQRNGNIFVYLCQGWSIVFYDLFDFEDGVDSLLVKLSSEFTEAQSFFIDTEYTFSTEWKLARNGEIVRAFASGETFGDEIVSVGAISEAEAFIDWEKLGQKDEEEHFAFGSAEVLKVARQWSVDPIFDQTDRSEGVVGFLEPRIAKSI